MTAPALSSVPTNAPQYELPPIPSASQWEQQAAPFSQLLQQAQTPPPPPVPAPPTSPPPAPQASKSTSTDNSESAANPIQDSTDSQSASSSNPPSNDTPATTAQPSTSAASTLSQTTASQTTASQNSPNESNIAAAKTAKADGKGKLAGKNSADADGTRPDGQTTAAVHTTTASVVDAPLTVATGKDDGKSSRDGSHDTTTNGSSDSNSNAQSPPVPVVSDPSAQAVATVVTTLAAGDNTVVKGKGVQADVGVTAVDGAALAATAAALAKAQPASVQATGGTTSSKAVASRVGGPAKAGPAQATLTAGDSQSLATAPASKYATVLATVAQGEVSAAASVDAGATAAVVQAVATVAASEPQVVSSITVDASTNSASTSPNAADSAPTANPSTTANNAPAATPSGFAASMTPNSSATSPALAGPSTVDRARFVQRVARAFQAAGDQGGQMRLRLSPPELGSLQMQISVKQGALSATIQADNSTAQQALLDSLPDLRDRLAQQDIRIERFDVQLTGQGSGGMPQSPQGNPDFAQPGRRSSAGANSVSNPQATSASSLQTPPVLGNGALNVVV
jgi:flagellar hook-length control protein FliK